MRSYKILEHTADIRLKVEGDNIEELFTAAAEGMASIIDNEACQSFHSPDLGLEINVKAPNQTALLIDFLSEILTHTHINNTIFCKAQVREITETNVRADIFGTKVSQFKEDIKAVTYHEANIQKNASGNYETVIVFDI